MLEVERRKRPEEVRRKQAEEERRKRAEEERRKRAEEERAEEERRKSPPFLEKWDAVRLIDRGSFGDVHEVLTDMGIKCAAKTIRLPVQLDDQQKLIDAERNLCKLIHRNIVRFLWILHRDAIVVLFMEFLDGVTLHSMVDGTALDEDKTIRFSSQICSALSYMHSQDPPVIHRDIKGSNIMVLADSYRVKLIDFGLSTMLTSGTHLTGSSVIPKGTCHFMAPELFGAESEDKVVYSRESDIWAFGCTVYQMATGSVPHAGCTNPFALPKVLERQGAPDLPAGCSKEWKDFYACCVARDRRKRKSAADLLSHRFLNEQGEMGEARDAKSLGDFLWGLWPKKK